MQISINIWAVLVSAVATMVIGSLWYVPLFGKVWMRLSGFTAESMAKAKSRSMAGLYLLAFVGSFITAYVLAHLAGLVEVTTFGNNGWQLAFWSWLGLIVPVLLGGYLWENKPLRLFLLNAAYYLVSIMAVVAILSSWK